MSKPLIAVTMGDPAEVGPEVCLQPLANTSVHEFVTPVILADKTGAKRACIFRHSEEVRASFVTVHCGYHEVLGLRTKERSHGTRPKIAMLGLNPHAGGVIDVKGLSSCERSRDLKSYENLKPIRIHYLLRKMTLHSRRRAGRLMVLYNSLPETFMTPKSV